MKKSLFLAMAISMGLLVGCGDSSSENSNPVGGNGDSSSSKMVTFPLRRFSLRNLMRAMWWHGMQPMSRPKVEKEWR